MECKLCAKHAFRDLRVVPLVCRYTPHPVRSRPAGERKRMTESVIPSAFVGSGVRSEAS